MQKILIFFFLFIFIKPLFAHHKVYGARVNKGDREISWRGHVDYDNRNYDHDRNYDPDRNYE